MNNRELALIFAFCAANVQVFMAYNGGATQGSVDEIMTQGKWGQAALGLLGAMDKIGMTISSNVWGWMLTKFEAKPLLVMGLAINWTATLLFAVVTDHYAMMAFKLLMGFTEGLQWVWSQSWVMNRTDGTKFNLAFLSISSGSAAIGNLLGTVIAGFGTANGLSYQFAFKAEAVGLLVSWIILLCVRTSHLRISKDKCADQNDYHSPNAIDHRNRTDSDRSTQSQLSSLSAELILPDDGSEDLPLREKYLQLWHNKLFRYCALGFSTIQYIGAAFAFQWIRMFEGLWGESKDKATGSLVLLPGLAGALGMFVGAMFSIKGARERRKTLQYLVIISVVEVAFAAFAFGGLLLQTFAKLQEADAGPAASSAEELDSAATLRLWITWVGIFGGIACAASCQASLAGISSQADVVGGQTTQTLAVGVQQCLTNFLGFAMGPLIPQILMSLSSQCFGWDADNDPRIAFVGGAAALFGTVFALLWISLAFFTSRQEGSNIS